MKYQQHSKRVNVISIQCLYMARDINDQSPALNLLVNWQCSLSECAYTGVRFDAHYFAEIPSNFWFNKV